MAVPRLSRLSVWLRNVLLVALFLLMSSSYVLWNNSGSRCYEAGQPEGAPEGSLLTEDVGELLACSSIVQGEIGADPGDLAALLRQRKRKGLPESFYLNATRDCTAFVRDRGFLTTPLSAEERDFPIAYSMVVHEKVEMFERLLRAVYVPQNVYCVHVDRKSPKDFVEAVRGIVSCFPNVFIASKLESVVYASWSRVQADLNCMQDLLQSPVRWKYLLNTCGTDFPIKTNGQIVQALTVLNGQNSMESEHTPGGKKRRWEYHHNVTDKTVIQTEMRKTPPPISTPMFSGNAYFVLSRAFVERLFVNPEAQALMAWERDTYSPDEHLWATLQRMPSMPGSTPHNSKYDRSDMIAIARLVKWAYHEGDMKKGAAYPGCNGVYRRAVCVYGARDLNWIITQHHLFANKFDPEVDEVAIRCLEHHLRYRALTGQPLRFSDRSDIRRR